MPVVLYTCSSTGSTGELDRNGDGNATPF
jgi:hypothetical protein